MRYPTAPRPIVATLCVLGLVLAACGADDGTEEEPAQEAGAGEEADAAGDEPTGSDDLLVVATTSILGDVAENVLLGDGEVEVVMPPGADPHGFEPSAQDAAMLREADLVIANGLQLEENLVSALEAAEDDGVEVLTLADRLDPIDFDFDGPDDHGHDDEGDGHGHDDEDGHDHGPEDPHFWHDPVRMADGVGLIAEGLSDVSEVVDAEEWERRAETYADEILAAHEEVEEILATVEPEDRVLITNHDAFGYLAVRYDLEVLGTVIPGASTQAEANPREFSQLIETVEDAGVEVIFSENTESDRLAEQLASEVVDRSDLDIEVVQLYSDALGEEGSGAETYLDMLRENARRIADALG